MGQPLKRYIKAWMNLITALFVLLVCIFVLPRILVFFMPFVIGWLIAWIANPLVRFFEEKLKIRRKAGSAVVIITVIAVILLAGYFAVAKLITEGMGFAAELPTLWKSMEKDFLSIGNRLDNIYSGLPFDVQESLSGIGDKVNEFLGSFVGNMGKPTVNAVGAFAKNLPNIIIGIVMCILSSYFFIAEKEEAGKFLGKYLPESVMEKWRIAANSMKTAVGGYFRAQLKIECWIFLLMLIGFFVLKIEYAVLIAFLIACLDFLPVFGTGTVMLPWAIITFISKEYTLTIGLLIIWGVGQLVRQLIQPKIVGDSVGVKPLPTLLLLFVGYKLAGVMGMIVAVPIGIILINLNAAGIFDNVKTSLSILVGDFNKFRQFDDDDRKKR